MPDNRVAPPSHFATAAADEVSPPDKGIASRATEPRGGGPHGAGVPGGGGDIPVDRRGAGAPSAHPPAKTAAPTPRNAAPGFGREGKTFSQSWREAFAAGHQAFLESLTPVGTPGPP